MDIGERDWLIPVVLGMVGVIAIIVRLKGGGIVALEGATIFVIGTFSTLEIGFKSFRRRRKCQELK